MHNHLKVRQKKKKKRNQIAKIDLDPGKKAAFFSNVKRLVDVTRGHNLFFSSEALRALEIRKPADLRIL